MKDEIKEKLLKEILDWVRTKKPIIIDSVIQKAIQETSKAKDEEFKDGTWK